MTIKWLWISNKWNLPSNDSGLYWTVQNRWERTNVSLDCSAAWFTTFSYHYGSQLFALLLLPFFAPSSSQAVSFSPVKLSLSLTLSLTLEALQLFICTRWTGIFHPASPSGCISSIFSSPLLIFWTGHHCCFVALTVCSARRRIVRKVICHQHSVFFFLKLSVKWKQFESVIQLVLWCLMMIIIRCRSHEY